MSFRDDSYLRHVESRGQVRLAQIAKDLRAMADEIERNAANKSMSLDRITVNTIHTITWGVANLNLDNLASIVSDWHEAADALRTINASGEETS